MMRHLLEGMKALEDQELRYARKDHGESFPTFAEGYLALMEEVQEAQEDWMYVNATLAQLMAVYRREGRVDALALSRMENMALHGACELVQVATVARKMRESGGSNDATSEESVRERLP